MERVLGLGGFFFISPDPAALAKWYDVNLGVSPVPTSYDADAWEQQSGPTAFAPMPEPINRDTDEFFWRDNQSFALNFRVRNLDAMVEQLRAAHTVVTVDPTRYPIGRFASLRDPDGNVVQLWEEPTVTPE
ncbi:MAG: VOC family protein [Actinomycetes bacterium]